MIFVPTADSQGVDTRITLVSGQSGFKTGYDRIFYIGTHFPSTLFAFVRRRADGTEEVLTSPAVKLACALKAGQNLRRGRAIVDDEAGRTVEAYVAFNGPRGEIPDQLDFDRLLLYAGAGASWLTSFAGDVAGAKTFLLAQARALDEYRIRPRRITNYEFFWQRVPRDESAQLRVPSFARRILNDEFMMSLLPPITAHHSAWHQVVA